MKSKNVFVKKCPTNVPDGWTIERWEKHWENCRRAEQHTGVAPITSDGWEKVAVMLMDQIDAKERKKAKKQKVCK
jgi:hypothetical protein